MSYEQKLSLWSGLISSGLGLTYGIFMLIYLNDAKKCDSKLTQRDRQFRQAAVVITWIEVILTGLYILGILFVLATRTQLIYTSLD